MTVLHFLLMSCLAAAVLELYILRHAEVKRERQTGRAIEGGEKVRKRRGGRVRASTCPYSDVDMHNVADILRTAAQPDPSVIVHTHTHPHTMVFSSASTLYEIFTL